MSKGDVNKDFSVEYIDKSKTLNFLENLQVKLDDYQLHRPRLSFLYAIYKKYGQDQGGYQAALITYYGFLSLFPLLVAAMSLAQLSLLKNAHIKQHVIHALNSYLPIVGHELQTHVHAEKEAGLALGISLLLTVYGARGVANALQQAMNHIWQVPRALRAGFPNAPLRSLSIIFIGGFGFMVSGVLSSYTSGLHNPPALRFSALVGSLLVVFISVLIVFKLSISIKNKYRDFLYGSITAALGLQAIQLIAGFLITHELRHFNSLYGSIGLVFVVLFWIYLQARILLYSIEIDSIRLNGLWPRSLTSFRLTDGDKRALKLYAKREAYLQPPNEEVKVNLDTDNNKPE